MIRAHRANGEGGLSAVFPFFMLLLLALPLGLLACGEASKPTSAAETGSGEALRLQGATMGTTWSASLHGAASETDWQTLLQAELDSIEADLTTWNPDSELMRFNRWVPDDFHRYFAAGEHLLHCFSRSRELLHETKGAFDPTVQPLVELWGFGATRDLPLPTEAQIQAAKKQSFFGMLGYGNYPPKGHIAKAGVPGLSLDFSGLAKGYAADRLAALAADDGCPGGLIEVGGEIRVFGKRNDGGPWRVGVEKPAETPGSQQVIGTILRIDPAWGLAAVATSGDSRNRRTIDDFTFSHILDPRTGWPVVDPPASVTVVARDCATADAWATALLVIGPEAGIPLVEGSGMQVCFQIREADGSYRELATKEYESLVIERVNR